MYKGSVFCPYFAILYFVCYGKKADCFTLTVFLMPCDSQCSVAFPPGVVGWSAVCDYVWTIF